MVIFKPTTKKELQKALMDWTYDDEESEKKYGPINTWIFHYLMIYLIYLVILIMKLIIDL